MKKSILIGIVGSLIAGGAFTAYADKTHVLNSEKNSLVLTVDDNGTAFYQYFGPKISDSDVEGMLNVNSGLFGYTLPAFGLDSYGDKALPIK